ncbi:MAG TPA: phosphotransferase [Acidobacteriaceae bacterium]|nr:phosphotransferase [Acidobacteriaceae bacterium]
MLSEIASQLSPLPLRHSAVLEGGYSNTNIVLEFADGERCVLRASPRHERLDMEADLLDFLSREAPQVPVPKVLWRVPARPLGGLRAFVMTYVEGEPLASIEDRLSRADCRHISEQLALVAAQIHKIRFAQCGLLGPGPKVMEPFASYVAGTLGFFSSCLDNPHLQRRVGVGLLERLRHCLTHRSDLHQPSWTHQLCHSDFNQKNLLMQRGPGGRYQLAAVLDWEFAFSASGVVDIGNILRFEHESPAVESAWFADAYRAAGAHLDKSWREQSLFVDLLAQCAFLINIEELPNTFRTAIGVMDRTLAVLDP